MDNYLNLIAGVQKEGEFVANINPSDTSDVVGQYAQGTQEDVAEAVAAAKQAFKIWSRSTPLERHAVLKKVAEEILKRKEELGTLLSREEGKTLAEGIGETVRAAQVFDFFAGEALRQFGEITPSVRPSVNVEVTREPVGVVGIITPWNFPIAIPAWKIAPALCYGNTVVLKPAELAPGCAWELTNIIHNAGVPEGVINLVVGQGPVVGQALLDNEQLDAVSFTGSAETGSKVAKNCARHLRKFQMEMGGKNALVVLDDADLDTALECAINGGFYSTGQRCTASSRIIVCDSIYQKFIEGMESRLRSLIVDHALKEGTHVGPVVDEIQLEKNERYVSIGKEEGATLKFGGQRLKRETEGFYMEPTLFTDCDNNMRICQEEIFGPVATVIKVKNYDEALEIANETPFGLSGGICTNSLKHATHFKRNAEVGMVMVNLPTAGVDFHVPFGGRKKSSYGAREQGRYAVDFFTTVKTAYTG